MATRGGRRAMLFRPWWPNLPDAELGQSLEAIGTKRTDERTFRQVADTFQKGFRPDGLESLLPYVVECRRIRYVAI